MLYNYFNRAIPYPSLHLGFSQIQPPHSNTMDTSSNEGNAEQQTHTQGNGSYNHNSMLEAFPTNDFDMVEGDMMETFKDSVESTLQHAMSDYHRSSEDPLQDQASEVLQAENDFSPASFAEASSSSVIDGEQSMDVDISSSLEAEAQTATTTDEALFDPYSLQGSTFEDGFLDQTGMQEAQIDSEQEMALLGPADHLHQPESHSKHTPDENVAHAVAAADVPTRPTSVEVTDTILSSDISAYRPGPIPPFKGRSKSASPPPSIPDNRYSIMANWPPPKPEFANRVDVYPPENAPLHVWIQAYALRWGVWLAEIKDEAIRDKVLAVVTEKMKAAWETAIREGYYLKPEPGDGPSDHEKGESDVQTKRGRKRAQSQSKLPAGFLSEGKDKFAITNGELAQHGITFDMITQRVDSQDFDAGELRYDEVLSNMDPDVITMRDWSVSAWGSIVNRNLLMYCFWVVQEERRHHARLTVLYKSFSKENQKKNTRTRMQGVREREYQHMALATELTLREQEAADAQEQQEDIKDDNESTPVDLTSEAEDDAEQAVESPDRPDAESSLTKRQVIELAKSVLIAPNEEALVQAFASYGIQAEDATLGGIVTDTEDTEEVKKMLVEIYANVNRSMQLFRQSRTQQPSVVLKMNHDIRLMQKNVGFLRQKLRHILSNLSKLPSQPQSDLQVHNTNIDHNMPQAQTTGPHPEDLASQNNTLMKSESSDEDNNSKVSEGRLNTTNNRNMEQEVPVQVPNDESVVEAPVRRDVAEQRAELKKLYVTERWVPLLNGMLAQRKLPLVSGVLDNWNPVRDVLQNQLGFGSQDRNTVLQNFKAGFHTFCLEKGVPPLDSSSKSPPPSTRSTNSPAPTQAPQNSPPASDWPSDAEILSAIPSQGIGAGELMQMFRARVFSDRPRFIESLRQLSLFDQTTFKVYPRQQALPPLNRQYNTLPPSSVSASQVQSGTMLSVPTPNKVVRLRMPQSNVNAAASLPRQDETNFPSEYKSKEVNTSRSFSFRYLPHATLEQRQRMDEIIEEYIANTIKRRQKGRWGQYIAFKDPQTPDGPVVAHGFWDLNNKGQRTSGVEWFYAGQDVPASWDADSIDDHSKASEQDLQQQQQSMPSSDQTQPRLKLKVSKPNTANDATKSHFLAPGPQTDIQPQQSFSTMQPQQHFVNFNGMLPTFNYSNYPGQMPQQPGMRQQQGFNNGHPATINPALLMMNPDQSSAYQTQQTGLTTTSSHQAQVQDNGKRGTKRAAPTQKASRNKKKVRKTVVPDDDDEDGDYDPSQDS